ncbi:MAG: DEAD/DEAH box helicase, partial [Myxococcales bacterium]
LRDGLGVPVPVGTPDAFLQLPEDPLGDLVSRYARSHGPFTTAEVAARLGLGEAVARQTLQRLAHRGRVLDGEFRPSGSGTEWCDAEVLRKLRRRSLARLRQEIEPVSHDAVARFLPTWQRVGGSLRGVDEVVAAIDQLAGCPVPASALEPLVLAARVRDYEPSMLDELTASGEVIWTGHAPLPGSDGWVSLHLADQAHLTLPEVEGDEPDGLQRAVLDALDPGGAWFFRQLADRVGSTSDADLSSALWELTWKGLVTNDTLAPLRALVRSGTPSHRTRRTPPRLGRTTGGRMPVRTGPPETAGRWALLPDRDGDPTRRAHARAEHLLERHGVVTRGAVPLEEVLGAG